MECPQCRADVPVAARFCPACGHELVVVGDQRRIATVLFADLVGFTALSETLDPEQVKGLVDRCFARLADDITAFGGRVDKVMGDAIVGLFGAPVAHEDDAERAVRAGLRMQETIATLAAGLDHSLQMRVGINSGEVLVGSVQAGREYTAMGDVVNTASRLQTAAAPGTVLVGPNTHSATRNSILYEAIDPVVARGKALPVVAHVAIRPITLPGQRLRSTRAPMVGRETELALLTGVVATAIDRSRAALLVVHGEAGMGKSRLAAEVSACASEELGAVVLEGRCVPYGEANVWWPVAEAIRAAAGLSPDDGFDAVDTALRRTATASLEQSGRLDEMDRVMAGLHHLLGHDTLRSIDVARAQEEAIRSVVAIAEGYSHRRPLVVVLSDIHWAEQEVLDLVDTLLGRLARRPFAVIATARRSLRDRWTPAPEAANSVVLHLDPLDAEAGHRLLCHLSDGALHPAMAAMLVDRAGGNPFYLEELVSLVTEAGVHTVDQLLATEAGELPTSLRGLVAARLDALNPVDRQMLDDAAVLGRHNLIDALVTMASVKRGVDRDRARGVVESLAAREFLILHDGQYSFRSDVIREVAYSTLTKTDRARSHAGIAQWIEHHGEEHKEYAIDQVASHYAAAAELVAEIGSVPDVPEDVRDRALDRLRTAWTRAQADSFPATVQSLTTRALGVMGDDPGRYDVLCHRARARADLYDLDGAAADAGESRALAAEVGDERGVAQALLVEADVAQHRGALTDALDLLDDAGGRFAAIGDRAGGAETERLRGMVLMFAGDFTAADEALRVAHAGFEAAGDPRGAAWVLQNLSWSAYIAGRVDEAEQRIGAAMAMFEELGDPGGLTWSRGLLAWVRFHQGRNDEALELAEEIGEDARERGETWGEAMMVVLTSSIALWSGRTDEAVEAAARAVELFGHIDDHMGELQARCGYARALVMSGDVEVGVAEVMAAVDTAAAADNREQSWLPRIVALTTAIQLGDLDLGHRMLGGEGGLSQAGTVGGTDQVAATGLHHLQEGDIVAARAVLDRSADEGGFVLSAKALAAAASGDHDAAIALADRVAAVSHTYLDRTYAEVARALARAGQGDVATAREIVGATLVEVDATGDRLAQALLRLVDAHLADVDGRADAETVRDVAEQRLAMLGITAEGWRGLLRDALGLVRAG